jgi:thiol-disulfide isomerase/thioredoxin
MQASHVYWLATAALAAALCLANVSAVAANPSPLRSNLPVEGQAPGFAGATTWLNSAPLTPQQLRGKVVLVDFWTYSCINCIRTVPYLRAWAAKYRDLGLLLVGVHTPEFRFEENLVNISAAVGRFHLDYPIAVDSNQQIWRAWGNQYWPAMYLADANGRIRYHQFGEGDYVRTERAIQSLLAEAHGAPVDSTLVNPAASGEQMAPDLASLRSGEAYVGYAKAANVDPGTQLLRDRSQTYAAGRLGMNQWGFVRAMDGGRLKPPLSTRPAPRWRTSSAHATCTWWRDRARRPGRYASGSPSTASRRASITGPIPTRTAMA